MNLEEITHGNDARRRRPRRRYHEYEGIGDWARALLPRRGVKKASADVSAFITSKLIGWPTGGWAGYQALEPLGEEAKGALIGSALVASSIYAGYKFFTEANQIIPEDRPEAPKQLPEPHRRYLPTIYRQEID